MMTRLSPSGLEDVTEISNVWGIIRRIPLALDLALQFVVLIAEEREQEIGLCSIPAAVVARASMMARNAAVCTSAAASHTKLAASIPAASFLSRHSAHPMPQQSRWRAPALPGRARVSG